MFSFDCGQCPSGNRGCGDCIVDVLGGENVQVDELSVESCGYVLAPDIRAAIETLRGLGMVTSVEILASTRAA